jgi:hypothetical protein
MFGAVSVFDIVVVLLYLFATAYLGWLGYRGTKTTTDYLVAGRKAHPFIMSLSYGATFISTSAIVGFGGVAGMFGMNLLWLTFCNIFVGIFIAFVFLGGPTRDMGHRLDAHTFPELLGRRYQSRFVQVLAGLPWIRGSSGCRSRPSPPGWSAWEPSRQRPPISTAVSERSGNRIALDLTTSCNGPMGNASAVVCRCPPFSL